MRRDTFDNAAEAAEVRQRSRSRSRSRSSSRHQRVATPIYKRRFVLLFVAILALGLLWTGFRVYRTYTAYQAASDEVDALRGTAYGDIETLTAADLAETERNLDELRLDLRKLESATSLPFGSEAIVSNLPWIGPRYEASREMVEVSLILADAGATGAQIGRETLFALDQSGITANPENVSPTWLDVLSHREADFRRVLNQIEEARAMRESIDTSVLPERTQGQLEALDSALNRVDQDLLLNVDIDALQAGLGAEGEKRYLLFFQNPAELRPSGGFPGTIALVTVERGQLKSYEFFPVRDLTYDYIDQRPSKADQPWAIQEYFPQDGFLLHDATWFADFPTGAETVMSMYAETDWPPIDGLIAVEPDAISQVMNATGPLTVVIDGEERQVAAENFYDEIERQRKLRRAGEDVETTHKEAVALIGEALLERLKSSDRQMLKAVIDNAVIASDRRDLQYYSHDPEVQAALDDRNWAGSLVPTPGTPTLAVAFANVAINKASLAMQPTMSLDLGDLQNGQREATLTMELQHTGEDEQDPLYGGFQRWWIEVWLPEGSTLTRSDPALVPNPESPNGGSYLVELFPGDRGEFEVEFSMPEHESLLVRRQPGLTPADLTVTDTRCERSVDEKLTQDITFDIGTLCGQSAAP